MINILSRLTLSVSELKKNPEKALGDAEEPVAILNRNKPVFYCIKPDLMESILAQLDDANLARLANERMSEPADEVSLNDL